MGILRRLTLITGLLLLLFLTLIVPQRPARAATARVATADDLMAAITTANGTPATEDTILLSADITLTTPAESDETYGSTGLPPITSNITIEGQGHSLSRNASGADFRIFRVAAEGSLTLLNLTVSNGTGSAGSFCSDSCGGSVLNEGMLTITHSLISAGLTNSGAGVYNAGTGSLTITDSTFSANTAGSGAGIYNSGFSSISITGVAFSDNAASVDGGALYTLGPLTISNSTFSANSAQGVGGALFNNSPVPMTLDNSTFSDNTSLDDGGAIFNIISTMTISNSTFSGNSASAHGGAISNNPSSTMTVVNSIIANSPSGGNCSDTSEELFTSISSLADDTTCPDFEVSDAIHLGSLAYYGGTVDTFSLNTGSAALDADKTGSCGLADARGVKRGIDADGTPDSPAPGDCDIGAFESGGHIRTLEFALPESSLVATAVSTFPVTLKLDAPLEASYRPITAYIRVSGGTALAGNDYVPFGVQTVTFDPGESSKTVILNLLNSALTADRTIILSFATQNGFGLNGPAQFGAQVNHTVTLKASSTNAAPGVNFYTAGTLTLTWTSINGATGYEIQVDTDTAFLPEYVYSDQTLSATTLSVTLPLANGVYYWRVRAKTVSGTGAWSPVERFEVYAP